MKKTTWIIVAVGAVLAAAGGVYFFIKKKKEMTMAGLSSDIELGGEQTTSLGEQASPSGSASKKISKLGDLSSGTQMSQIPSQPATTASAAVAANRPAAVVASKTAAPAGTSSLPAGTGKVLRVVKDESKGKAILRISPKGLFKTGDTAKVKGNVYNGSFRVWYVFKSHATEDGVYIDTAYKGDDVGTVSK